MKNTTLHLYKPKKTQEPNFEDMSYFTELKVCSWDPIADLKTVWDKYIEAFNIFFLMYFFGQTCSCQGGASHVY